MSLRVKSLKWRASTPPYTVDIIAKFRHFCQIPIKEPHKTKTLGRWTSSYAAGCGKISGLVKSARDVLRGALDSARLTGRAPLFLMWKCREAPCIGPCAWSGRKSTAPLRCLAYCRPRLPCQFGPNLADRRDLSASVPMPPCTIALACRCATARAVHPADGPAKHGGRLAGVARPLGRGATSRRILEPLGRVHGVGVVFHSCPTPLSFFPEIQWRPKPSTCPKQRATTEWPPPQQGQREPYPALA